LVHLLTRFFCSVIADLQAYWSGQAMWALLVGGPVYLVNLQPEAPAAASTPAHSAFAYVPLVDPVSIGLTLYVLGLFVEWRADAEKAAFKHAPHSATRKPWIDTGMWALSRHPNYLGEIMLWTGISLMAADSIQQPTAATVTACVLSPLFLTLLLTRVSGIPLLEEHADKSFGHDAAYQAYKARTGVLLPLPIDRAVRFAWRLLWACTAFAAAYFCGRMFTYVAHSMKIPLTEPTAWPFYFTQPLQFELLPVALAAAHPALRVLVNTLWNVLLVAQFGFCHVGFARPAVYRACGSRYHRVLFMLVTCASFHLIILLWRHNHGLIVWDATPLVQSALDLAGVSVSRATVIDVLVPLWGLVFIILCLSTVFKLDVLYFIGAKQPLMSDEEEQKENEEFARELVARETFYAKQKANNKAAAASSSSSSSAVSEPVHGQKQLMVSGMYRFVRHPMYFWLQTLCVCTPYMSLDRLVYSAATTALLWIGLRFEERKLVREFGNDYVEYQKRTPMLFPDWRMCKSQKKKGKTQ
jgi:steroid 5-alpha reductase family enzyme